MAITGLLATQLAGCMTVPPEATGLHAVAHADALVLKEPASYEIVGGLVNMRLRRTLLPGVYRAEKENASGVFYQGEGRLLRVERVDDPGSTHTPSIHYEIGGVWIPKDTSQSPRVWRYVVDSDANPGAAKVAAPAGTPILPGSIGSGIGNGIVNALIRADIGKIALLEDPKNLDFASKVMAGTHTAPQ